MEDFLKISIANHEAKSRNTSENFCHYLKDILNDEFDRFWKEQVHQTTDDSGKLKIYKKIKVNMGIERYLFKIRNFKYRQAVTRLRISAHRLPVETGRYKKISFSDRKCKHCDQNEVGDERHYLMSCGNIMFTFLRQNFLVAYITSINLSSLGIYKVYFNIY